MMGTSADGQPQYAVWPIPVIPVNPFVYNGPYDAPVLTSFPNPCTGMGDTAKSLFPPQPENLGVKSVCDL